MENKNTSYDETIIINKAAIMGLIGYVHTLLDFICVEDFEDEENKTLVNSGYENFVKPVMNIIFD